jgi:WD40 repeat protein
VLSTTLTSNGKWLVSASKDCALLIWDPSDAQFHCKIVGHSNSGALLVAYIQVLHLMSSAVISVDSSAHGDMIASGSGDCLVRVCAFDCVVRSQSVAADEAPGKLS